MRIRSSLRQAIQAGIVLLALVGALLAILAARGMALPAQAAAGTGTIAGQVVWCAPLPLGVPDQGSPAPGQEAPATPQEGMSPPPPSGPPPASSGVAPDRVVPPLPVHPPYGRYIPAGAVLVAVQGTALSARTDENGRFRIENVPAGQYLTVAAGPVGTVSTAVAIRPNVFIQDGGQTAELGRLMLGTTCSFGPLPYGGAGTSSDASEASSDSPSSSAQGAAP